MTNVEEFATTRGEYYRLQNQSGADYKQMPVLKRRAEALWAAMTEPQKRAAEDAYFAEVTRVNKSVPR